VEEPPTTFSGAGSEPARASAAVPTANRADPVAGGAPAFRPQPRVYQATAGPPQPIDLPSQPGPNDRQVSPAYSPTSPAQPDYRPSHQRPGGPDFGAAQPEYGAAQPDFGAGQEPAVPPLPSRTPGETPLPARPPLPRQAAGPVYGDLLAPAPATEAIASPASPPPSSSPAAHAVAPPYEPAQPMWPAPPEPARPEPPAAAPGEPTMPPHFSALAHAEPFAPPAPGGPHSGPEEPYLPPAPGVSHQPPPPSAPYLPPAQAGQYPAPGETAQYAAPGEPYSPTSPAYAPPTSPGYGPPSSPGYASPGEPYIPQQRISLEPAEPAAAGAGVGVGLEESPPPGKSGPATGVIVGAVLIGATLLVLGALAIPFLLEKLRGPDGPGQYSVGDCVVQEGENAQPADCGDPDAYEIVSQVDNQEDCDPTQPAIEVEGTPTQVYCLAPAASQPQPSGEPAEPSAEPSAEPPAD
jgi:hypothetical protein